MSARDTIEELLEYISDRWRAEQNCERYMGWRALRGWLLAEAWDYARIGYQHVALVDDLLVLSRIAHRYALDLEPTREETPA